MEAQGKLRLVSQFLGINAEEWQGLAHHSHRA